MTSVIRQATRSSIVRVLAAALICALAISLFTGVGSFGATSAGAQQSEQPSPSNFEKVTLTDDVGEPGALAVLPDGRVLHTARNGELRMWSPETKSTRVIANLDVYSHDEEGLQSVAVDPNFEQNGWVYLYYSPPLDTPPGDAPNQGSAADFEPYNGHLNLSRFKLTGDELDLSSEQVLLEVPADRGICCHVGGHIDFDNEGNLYLSTGDDTNPFASQGYAPLDERENRNPAYDAQRTAANTNDLRGKVLRINPQPDGSYTIPEDNLFEPGAAKTKPEIYAMGLRNPYRFAVDPETGRVYMGDYSPDAGSPDPERGPAGQGEWMVIKEAGNYGWPYCAGPNLPYNDYNFATGQSGSEFDCSNPVNESPNNTGLTQLPPAQPADVWYSYNQSEMFPELGTGGLGPMGGPVYNYDPDLQSGLKFPESYDGSAFFYEWTRDYIKEFKLGGDGQVSAINDFLPDTIFDNPMDMEFGPEGALYLLEYGDGYFGENPEAQLSRVQYAEGNKSPIAEASATPTSGQPPLEVKFSSEGSSDPEGGDLSYAWDFDGDGEVDSKQPNPTHTYDERGDQNAQLVVTDSSGRFGVANVNIAVGNTTPEIEVQTPPNGGFFEFGDSVPYKVEVTDPEDGQIDCSRVEVSYVLGHDQHGHPLSSTTGCQGVLETVKDNGHSAEADIFGVMNVSYTDEGAPGVEPLTANKEVILQPKRKQVEHFTSQEGVQTEASGDPAGGGDSVGSIQDGDYISFDPMSLKNINSLTYRLAESAARGKIEVRLDSPTGEVIGELGPGRIKQAGGSQDYKNVTVPIENPGGSHELFFVFKEAGNTGEELFDLNWIDFNGQGVSSS